MRRKIQSAFACFTKVGQIPEIFPATRIKGKLVSTIRQEMAPGIDILGVRYGTFQEAVKDDDVLLEKYPNISRSQQPNKFLQQEYTIIPLNLENKDNKWILFEVKSNCGQAFPKFLVPITPALLENGSVQDLLQVGQESLDLENTPIMIKSKEGQIDSQMRLTEFFELAKTHQMVFHTEFSEKSLERVKKRSNIIHEIYETEKQYVAQLEKIITFWNIEIKKKKIFTDVEMKMIFNDISSIFNCHKIFLDDLGKLLENSENNQGAYSTQVAGLFVSHASLFDVAVTYISSYPQINDVVVEKCEHSNSAKKDLFELAAKCDGKDLLSFLIAPVQRIPRYQLFLRDLLKNTPTSHPDTFLIKEAANAIERMLRKIDIESKSNAQMWRLKQLEKNLLNSFKLYIPTRRFVFQTKVQVKGHSDNQGTIYIFNDIILLTKEQSKGVSVLFDSPSDQFHYHLVIDNSLAIVVSAVLKSYNKSMINPRKDYVVIFPSKQVLKEFFTHLVTNQMERTQPYEFDLDWALMNTTALPPVEANAGAANGSEFIFFGGNKQEKSTPTAQLSAINQLTLEYTEINASAKGRCGHTLTLIGSRLFIVGGRNSKRFFKKILCYDLKTNIWSQQLPSSTDDFEPRYGHTTTLWDNRLVIFGGRTQDGKILNSITIFDPFDNMFVTLRDVKNAPPPRYHHSAVLYGNSIFIYGGKTTGKKLLNDIWEFQIDKQIWIQKTTRGETLIPRKCHAQYLINCTTLIVGGVTTGGESAQTVQIDLETFIAKKVIDTGNVPNALRKFASFVDRNGKLYAYGGMERKSKQPCASFYLLKPNEKWLKEILQKKHNEETTDFNIENIFYTQNRKSTRLNFLRRTQSIVGSLFSNIDVRTDDVDEESGEQIRPRRSRSPNPRPKARSARSSQQYAAKAFTLQSEKEINIPQPTVLPRPSEMDEESPLEGETQQTQESPQNSIQTTPESSASPVRSSPRSDKSAEPVAKPRQKKLYSIVIKPFKKKEKKDKKAKEKQEQEPKILFPEREINLEEEEVPEAEKKQQEALAAIPIFNSDAFPTRPKATIPETKELKEEKQAVSPSNVSLSTLLADFR